MIRVLIADGRAILRRGLKEIVLREFRDALCEEAGEPKQVLGQVRSLAWDLLILGFNIPGRSGLEFLSELRQLRPELPVLVLSAPPEHQYGKRVLRAGAAGYLDKETAPEELVRAIRKILAGGRYVNAALAEKLASELNAGTELPLHEELSNREFEILRMIAMGKTNAQIAGEMVLSPSTVSTYRRRVLVKMGMTTNAELMRYAMDNDLID